MHSTTTLVVVAAFTALAAASYYSPNPSISYTGVSSSGSDMCNGHGYVYSDSPGVCICHDCYNGTYCESAPTTCNVTAAGGNPLLFQEFWSEVPTYGMIEELSDWRTGYQVWGPWMPSADNPGAINDALAEQILALHDHVGNVNTTGYSLVWGTGCTGLLSAAEWAYQQKAGGGPMNVFVEAPYYDGYTFWPSVAANLTFTSDMNLPDNDDIIQFVTLPNNPTGVTNRSAVYSSPNVIYDMVYNWPSLTTPTDNADFPVMLFSLSKLTGHAGTRFGWAFVKDPEIAQLMTDFIGGIEINVGISAQYRALSLLSFLNADNCTNADKFFNFIKNKLTARWNTIEDIFANQTKYVIESVPNQFYLWVHCTEKGVNCYDVFADGGVIGETGVIFGASEAYVRIELVGYDSTWKFLSANLASIVQG